MEKLTSQIIMICKQPDAFGNFSTNREAVTAFLAVRNGDKEYWERPEAQKTVNEIIYAAALDYMDCCKKPSLFVREIFDCLRIYELIPRTAEYRFFDAVLGAFSLAQVMSNGEYINGFTEENTVPPTPETL